jgi:HlyD family secretion protein
LACFSDTSEVLFMPAGEAPTIAPLPSTEKHLDLMSDLGIESIRGRSHKPLLKAAAVLAILAAITALLWRFSQRQETPELQLASLTRGRIESTVSAAGACNAVVTVQVGSQVSGNIKALYADFNSQVKAGELVALIDPEILQARVKQAEASWKHAQAAVESASADYRRSEAVLEHSKAVEQSQLASITKARAAVTDAYSRFVRRQQLYEEKVVSKEDLDTAESVYKQATAELVSTEAQHHAAVQDVRSAEAAQFAANEQVRMAEAEVVAAEAALNQTNTDLAHTLITAPVDGTVVARRMDVGQTVAASFQAPTIFEIAQDLTRMQIDTNVAESDIGRLDLGQEATFTVDAYPGIPFKGKITQIRRAPINVQNVITYDAVIEVASGRFPAIR